MPWHKSGVSRQADLRSGFVRLDRIIGARMDGKRDSKGTGAVTKVMDRENAARKRLPQSKLPTSGLALKVFFPQGEDNARAHGKDRLFHGKNIVFHG
jgi:hypothetical protein